MNQVIITKTSLNNGYTVKDEKGYSITHFSVQGPQGIVFKIYYNGLFSTSMLIPNNKIVEIQSEVINVEKIVFDSSIILNDDEKIIVNYETTQEQKLNTIPKNSMVQYIQGSPGPGIKAVDIIDNFMHITLSDGTENFIPGNFVGNGIKNQEDNGIIDNQDGSITINLTNGDSYNILLPQGEKGEIGYYYTPILNENGDLEWSNNGGLTNPNSINIKGPVGPVGPNGKVYVPALDELGNLSWQLTSISEEDSEQILTKNIRGPQGIPGPQGLQGPQGLTGPIGPRGETGIQGRGISNIQINENKHVIVIYTDGITQDLGEIYATFETAPEVIVSSEIPNINSTYYIWVDTSEEER